MANTKVTGDLIASGTITAANLVTGTLDGLLNTYLTTNAYATQSYVTTAVNNLIDSAPASLDTLNELAAALNDDANFATTVTNALATKLNLSGGNITGNLSVDTDTFYVDSSNNRVGIGIGSPTTALDVRSGDTSTQITIGASNGGTYGRLYADNDGDLILGADAGDNAANSYMGFEVDGSERMRIDSSGNVGIGTSSPAARIDYGSATGEAFYLHNGSGDVYGIDMAVYDGDGFSTNIFSGGGGKIKLRTRSAGANPLTTKMTIDSSGNVGIGTSSPTHKLSVFGDTGSTIFSIGDDTGTHPLVYIQSDADNDVSFVNSRYAHPLAFKTDDTERMRITSGGDVLIGTTTTSDTSSGLRIVSAQMRQSIAGTGLVDFHDFYRGTEGSLTRVGNIRADGSSTSYNTSSDYRLKENVAPMEGALDRVSQLQPSRFNFISDPNKIVDGFLAHQVQEVVPEAISGEKDEVDEKGNPVYQGIDQSKLVPLLVGAIQELKDIVDQQQIEIDNLKAQLNG